MKTLAAVTVVFLPSTFVAAFFSMPLFQWDGQTVGDSAVSRQFWIYSSVSIPLTVITVGSWLLWMRLQAKRNDAMDLEDQQALDGKWGES